MNRDGLIAVVCLAVAAGVALVAAPVLLPSPALRGDRSAAAIAVLRRAEDAQIHADLHALTRDGTAVRD